MPRTPLAFKIILPIVAAVRLASIIQLTRETSPETLVQSYGPVGLGLLTYTLLAYTGLAAASIIPGLRDKYLPQAAGLALLSEILLLAYTLTTPHLEATPGYLAYAVFNTLILALSLVASYAYPEPSAEGIESTKPTMPPHRDVGGHDYVVG
ncbi:MAG: hypothetical protein GSR78_03960 [Desulfurococcales archaeon]|nr:hypothetical protein [Desulfurococcales archaeon]